MRATIGCNSIIGWLLVSVVVCTWACLWACGSSLSCDASCPVAAPGADVCPLSQGGWPDAELLPSMAAWLELEGSGSGNGWLLALTGCRGEAELVPCWTGSDPGWEVDCCRGWAPGGCTGTDPSASQQLWRDGELRLAGWGHWGGNLSKGTDWVGLQWRQQSWGWQKVWQAQPGSRTAWHRGGIAMHGTGWGRRILGWPTTSGYDRLPPSITSWPKARRIHYSGATDIPQTIHLNFSPLVLSCNTNLVLVAKALNKVFLCPQW